MKIKIPTLAKYSIKLIGNITLQKTALNIYIALYKADKRKNPEGYFEIPSTYLKSISGSYNRIIHKFIEDGIIDYYKTKVQDNTDIFKTKEKKYYNRTMGICMRYKFLVDITKGEEIDIEIEKKNIKKHKWYNILNNSLASLGYSNIKITRDDFGRRVHHNLTQTYKYELANKGYMVIDAKCSQPKLLYLMMKEKGIVDTNYNNIFENNLDFYNELIKYFNLEDRQQAKDLFMYWLNSETYVPTYKINNIFPNANSYIKKLKINNYKNSASTLQRKEADIWIDDLLENLPVEFGLTIHDSLIIKEKDALKVLKYCKTKYSEIDFDIKEL